jgi:OOP family OmpA-OmpF porin
MVLKKRGAQSARLLAAAVAMSTFATSATAQDEAAGFYFGAFGGQSSYDAQEELDELFLDAFDFAGLEVLDAESDLDDPTGFGVTAGYKFNRYFALEASYFDLGSASYSAEGLVTDGFFTLPMEVGASLEAKGPAAAAIASIPLSDSFALYGKVGMFFADTEVAFSVEGDLVADPFTSSTEEVFFGAGLSWKIGAQFALDFAFQRFTDVGDEEATGEVDIDLMSIGFNYRL